MKLLLIKPKWFIKGGVYRILENVRFTPLHLGIIAALSDGHEVKVIDADWDEIPYYEKYDLVGISVTTFTSQQAYRIAKNFRQSGAKVVFGGVHPTLLQDECLEHVDAVVIGEAEYVWKDVLKDAQAGNLKKIYKGNKIVNMNDVPFPKRELLNEQSWIACIQATRGCPNTCRYCYLPSVSWKTYRKRNIDLVYEELKRIKQNIIFFVDDNLFADEDYAIQLFDKIAPLKKIWSIQAPTTIAKNEKILEKMALAGCFNVQMGFQTVNSKSLEWAAIEQNRVEDYKEIIAKLHKYKMLVTGFFMFGFDTDDKGIFDESVKMIKEIDIDDVHLYILTLYPGTQLYEQFKLEGRLLENRDRTGYGWSNAMFQPKFMSPEDLENGVQETYSNLYGHFRKRLPRKILERLGWLIKYPDLFYTVVAGNLGKKDISKKVQYTNR
ncbi:MAG: B12-binding domain-containing radical SAM protein [Elusimicrobia bacterium]|nr:B12-binding domain-containing radical SAM protein [Candidatus Liberimonas magnetica]